MSLSAPCKLWVGTCTDRGYGQTRVDGKHMYVHRLVYIEAHGAIPDGLQIDHLCRVRNCYEVSHLEAVTPAENTRRGDAGKARGAQMRARTHCPQGHPYDEQNTAYRRNGKYLQRQCKACRSARWHAWNARRKVAAA